MKQLGSSGDPTCAARRPAARNENGVRLWLFVHLSGINDRLVPSGQWPDGTGGSPVPPLPDFGALNFVPLL